MIIHDMHEILKSIILYQLVKVGIGVYTVYCSNTARLGSFTCLSLLFKHANVTLAHE
jgi:hypothetical protein